MIQSMTGYGRSEGYHGDFAIVVELRSTNHKYCDIVVRLPKFLVSLETPLKKLVQQRFTRGRLELAVTVNGAADQAKQLDLDLALAEQYLRILKELKTKLELPGHIDLSLLTGFRDIITVSEMVEATDALVQRIHALVKEAMGRLETMRGKEGLALANDLRERIRIIEKSLHRIKGRVPTTVQGYQTRLKERVEQLTKGIKLDQSRLVQEVAIFAERCDVNEELIRLKSHLKQFKAMIKKKEAVGRSLDFLIQEMNREVNTIGSKASDAAVALEVVGMKSELEKLREQVQNIE